MGQGYSNVILREQAIQNANKVPITQINNSSEINACLKVTSVLDLLSLNINNSSQIISNMTLNPLIYEQEIKNIQEKEVKLRESHIIYKLETQFPKKMKQNQTQTDHNFSNDSFGSRLNTPKKVNTNQKDDLEENFTDMDLANLTQSSISSISRNFAQLKDTQKNQQQQSFIPEGNWQDQSSLFDLNQRIIYPQQIRQKIEVQPMTQKSIIPIRYHSPKVMTEEQSPRIMSGQHETMREKFDRLMKDSNQKKTNQKFFQYKFVFSPKESDHETVKKIMSPKQKSPKYSKFTSNSPTNGYAKQHIKKKQHQSPKQIKIKTQVQQFTSANIQSPSNQLQQARKNQKIESKLDLYKLQQKVDSLVKNQQQLREVERHHYFINSVKGDVQNLTKLIENNLSPSALQNQPTQRTKWNQQSIRKSLNLYDLQDYDIKGSINLESLQSYRDSINQ